MTNSTDTNIDHVPSKKKLRFEDDLTTVMTTTSEVNATTSSEPMDDDINFVYDILDSTCEMEDVQSVQSLDSDDEFNVKVWSVSKARNWPFRPLAESSCNHSKHILDFCDSNLFFIFQTNVNVFFLID